MPVSRLKASGVKIIQLLDSINDSKFFLYKKNPAVETTGCKPKPTAYEKAFYCIVISCAGVLTSAFLGRFNVKTPLTYFASIPFASIFSSSVKDLLKLR